MSPAPRKSAGKPAAPCKRAAGKAVKPAATPSQTAALESAEPEHSADSRRREPRPVWEGNGETRQQFHARVEQWREARRAARNGES